MPKKPPADRSASELREHYEVEKELAGRLRASAPGERQRLYTSLYDELFRRLPRHPQLQRKQDPAVTRLLVALQMPIIRRYLRPGATYLEVGPGDCMLVREVAGHAARCYAIDVSTEITRTADWPANLEMIISDGSSVPVPEGSVDVAYSNQLMEHLHPNDAMQQLRNLHRALRPGGVYICRTPSRLSGPHDVSAYFDEVATGFHLREYAYRDLSALFREAGFRRLEAFVVLRGRFVPHPLFPVLALEALLGALPRGLAGRLARTRPAQLLLGVNLVGRK